MFLEDVGGATSSLLMLFSTSKVEKSLNKFICIVVVVCICVNTKYGLY